MANGPRKRTDLMDAEDVEIMGEIIPPARRQPLTYRRPPSGLNGAIQNGKGKGRPKGVPNRTTGLLKEAILRAGATVGRVNISRSATGEELMRMPSGQDGLQGYLEFLAVEEPRAHASLLARVLPLQIQGKLDHEHRTYPTAEELREELEKRGLPTQVFEPIRLEDHRKRKA